MADLQRTARAQPIAKVLIVDDDPDLISGLRRLLISRGFAVVSCEDAAFAMTKVVRDEPDVMILDIGLPGGGGPAVLERVRAHDDFYSMPVIILTGGSETLESTLIESGADAFFTKPADIDDLTEAIAALTGVPFPDAPSVAS